LRGVDVPDFFDHVGRVGLRAAPDQKIASYSKGMKQRLLLALALVGDPQILVLDEPTSGLDPFGREEIEALLLGLAKNHQLIISTHSLDLACRLEAEVIILKEGDVAWRGRPKSQQELVTLFRNCRPKELDR
ncbi:MAG: ATP-binding cassette domain-containing protein, partial [Campylobacterales bacterium]